jgi:hypothetical protein
MYVVAATVVVAAGVLVGGPVSCGGSGQVVNAEDEPELVAKHNWRSESKAGWKAEGWATGSAYESGSPLDFAVRLTSPGQGALPKVKLTATLVPKAEVATVLRQAAVEPVFRSTANAKPRIEAVVNNAGISGDIEPSPAKEGCWEAFVADPFECGARTPGRKYLAPGYYLVAIVLVVDGGAEFTFRPIPVRIIDRTKARI